MFHNKRHDHHQDREGRKRFARRDRDDTFGEDEERGHGGRFFRGGGHGGHRRHGQGLGRFFAHGDLRLVVLSVVDEKASHGYEIIKAIEDRVGGAYSPSPGVIYPTLTLLEELGYITSKATERSKKLCEITAEGKAYLKANQKTLDELFARMDDAGRSHRRGAAPQIVRAMENLKLALRLRSTSAPLSEEQVTAIAAAIDAAAVAVEKV
jgi:DNA-binding PadR family transcriptional regulator